MLVLDQSGLGEILDESGLEFVDLNHDDVDFVPNRLRQTTLSQLALPASLQAGRPDRFAAQAQDAPLGRGHALAQEPLRRHAGDRLRMAQERAALTPALAQSILDIAAAVRPHLAIVDGIVGMEGDGPIMGTPRRLGVLVMGTNLPAVDATCARLMQIDPHRVGYLAAASARLGPIAERHISQRGEAIAALAQPFQLVDQPWLSGLRG